MPLAINFIFEKLTLNKRNIRVQRNKQRTSSWSNTSPAKMSIKWWMERRLRVNLEDLLMQSAAQIILHTGISRTQCWAIPFQRIPASSLLSVPPFHMQMSLAIHACHILAQWGKARAIIQQWALLPTYHHSTAHQEGLWLSARATPVRLHSFLCLKTQSYFLSLLTHFFQTKLFFSISKAVCHVKHKHLQKKKRRP